MTSAATVADVMLRRPTIHPPDTTVSAAREAFAASPKLHLLLLVHDGRLVGTLDRDDLATSVDPGTGALASASLDGRTGAPAERHRADMVASGVRRLAVIDGDLRLLGLLCLKASGSGFCTDEGVDGMRRGRNRRPNHSESGGAGPTTDSNLTHT